MSNETFSNTDWIPILPYVVIISFFYGFISFVVYSGGYFLQKFYLFLFYSTSNAPSFNPNIKWTFLLKWVLAHMVGLVGLPALVLGLVGLPALVLGMRLLAYMVGDLVGGLLPSIERVPVLRELLGWGYFFVLALGGAIIGGWIGLIQWLVLRQQVPRANRWFLASSVGIAVGMWVNWLLFIILESVLRGIIPFLLVFVAVFSITIGVPQWFVLKQWTYQAGWWILVIAVSLILGVILYLSGWFGTIFAGPIVFGVVTGTVLFWLLRFQRKLPF